MDVSDEEKKVYNIVVCLPSLRVCSGEETPNDVFNKILVPVGFVLLALTFLASFYLHLFANNYYAYLW